jgi:hypothetical protein
MITCALVGILWRFALQIGPSVRGSSHLDTRVCESSQYRVVSFLMFLNGACMYEWWGNQAVLPHVNVLCWESVVNSCMCIGVYIWHCCGSRQAVVGRGTAGLEREHVHHIFKLHPAPRYFLGAHIHCSPILLLDLFTNAKWV